MVRSLYDLFRRCTVCIFTSTGSQGTGFFVAPGLILTCTHVIQPGKSAPQPAITILWNQQTYTADIEQLRDYPYPDIALLRVVSPACPDHPYAPLDEEIEIADELYCYGYPDDYPDGDSVTLKYEGPTEKQGQLLKLKEGVVRPGLSGAPLLNTRTKRVCGIMKLTRDRGMALGGRAIPISIVFQEFAQVKIAQHETYRGNQQWNKALADVNPTHLAYETTSYFSFLSSFLEFEGQWFRDDLQHKRIYFPEKEYFSQLKTLLDTKKLALLLGHSAAGKTVLALAFAQYLQDQAGYTICYKDVRQARMGDGRKWHALMLEHDYPKLLYILDNCHLAPGEVDDFCYQWRDNHAPTSTQCLLISRTSSAQAYSEAMQADDHPQTTPILDKAFFFSFAANEKIILVIHPETVFRQVIEQYALSLADQDAAYMAALKSDNQEKLARLLSHNLVISRSYLDTWQALGASLHLSNVRLHDTYQMLEDKYLSTHGATLAELCVLQRYEIRIHNSFIKQFPVDEIKRLEDEKLLIHTNGPTGYGQLYDLVLHSSEARELVHAYVYNQHGHLEYLNDFVLSTIESYLKTKPDNYIAVYDNLAQHKQHTILKQLLENPALQQCIASQLKNKETVLDAIRYVYRVAKFDRKRALSLINDIMHTPGIEVICNRLLKATFHNISLYLQCVYFIDVASARHIVHHISSNTTSIKRLAIQAQEENMHSLFRLIRTLQDIVEPEQISSAQVLLLTIPLETLAAKVTIPNLQDTVKYLQAYQYPAERIKQLIASLDMRQFARTGAGTSLQTLFWALHTLKKVSPAQVQLLIQCLPLHALSSQASNSNPGSIYQIIHILRNCGYRPEQLAAFVEALDMEQIAQHMVQHPKKGTLRHLTALLHALHSISRASEVKLLDMLPSTDMLVLLQYSSLKIIGSFLQDQYTHHHVREAYTAFQSHILPQRLAAEPLAEINKFLDHLSRIRGVGPQLVHYVLDLLVTGDIAKRLAQVDLAQYAQLLRHARALNMAVTSQLLTPLYYTSQLHASLAHSNLHAIQLLIHQVASLDTNALSTIRQILPAINVTPKFAEAPLRDIGHFLWNSYSFIDKSLACTYSIYVDQHLPIQRVIEASPEDVCLLLWNIASISDAPSLRLLDKQVVHALLQIWRDEAGWSAVLAGIVAITHDPMSESKHTIALQITEEALYSWLMACKGRSNPYFLALALQGLRAYNEHMAYSVVRYILLPSRVRDQIQSIKPVATTARSIALRAGIIQWLEQFFKERS